MGWASYSIIRGSQVTLAETEFSSLADRALHFSAETALRKRRGLTTLSSMASEGFPSAVWPFVQWHGFETIVNHLIDTASGDSMSLLPVVMPEQLQDFEAFASSLYPETGVTRVTGLDENFQSYNELLLFCPSLIFKLAAPCILLEHYTIESVNLFLWFQPQ